MTAFSVHVSGRVPKLKAALARAVTVEKACRGFLLDSTPPARSSLQSKQSVPSSTLQRGQSVGAGQAGQIDYELGKTYGMQDANQYFGGMRGDRQPLAGADCMPLKAACNLKLHGIHAQQQAVQQSGESSLHAGWLTWINRSRV